MATAELLPPAVVAGTGFRHSESFTKLAEALLKAQSEFGPLKKDTKNPFYNAHYATLDQLIEVCQPVLAKHGLVIMQPTHTDIERRAVTVTTLLIHSTSGEWFADDLTLPAESAGKDGKPRFDPQSVGSAITYGRRYAYQSFVGIAAEEDDDANSFVKEPQRKAVPAKSVPQTLNEAVVRSSHFISEAEHTRFWQETRRTNKTREQVIAYLGSEGIESSTEIPRKDFQKHLTWATEQ